MKEKNPWCTLSKILVLNYKPGTRFPIEENIWDTGFWKSIVHLKKKEFDGVPRCFKSLQIESGINSGKLWWCQAWFIDPGIVCLIVPSA